jgi:pimeloyl-ACP methyl ester carboxylesterase
MPASHDRPSPDCLPERSRCHAARSRRGSRNCVKRGVGSHAATSTKSRRRGMARWWARRAHAAASPGAARQLLLMNRQIDIRGVLSSVRVPASVMHRTGERDSRSEEGRYLAARIPGARFLELSGDDHLPADPRGDGGVPDRLASRARLRPSAEEPLVFTDIVCSTEWAASLGDLRRQLLDPEPRRRASNLAASSGIEAGT